MPPESTEVSRRRGDGRPKCLILRGHPRCRLCRFFLILSFVCEASHVWSLYWLQYRRRDYDGHRRRTVTELVLPGHARADDLELGSPDLLAPSPLIDRRRDGVDGLSSHYWSWFIHL